MFDFFFKKRPSATPSNIPGKTPQPDDEIAEKTAEKAARKLIEKQTELEKAESFSDQEEAALVFLLQSNYADARLKAVKHIHSYDALLQVSKAMRDTDRRVSKLAHEKLTVLLYQQKMHLAVQDCLQQGQQLLQQPHLMINQVSLWDKERLSLGEYGAPLQQVKSDLGRRLQEQIDLQRAVMQLAEELHLLVASTQPVDQLHEKLVECEQQQQRILSSAVIASLPKNQLAQLDQEFDRAKSHLQKMTESSQVATQAAEEIQPQSEPVVQSAPVVPVLVLPIEPEQQRIRQQPAIDLQAVLNSLEQALAAGSLQQALDIDKTLRSADITPRGEMSQRLQALRGELSRLLDWAKWGGNVSREELIKVADSLQSKELAPSEIAKQVGGLRARWKELDRTSGVATKSLWERFDEACSRAYSIADSYFKQQAQLRLENFQLAQSQLAAMDVAIVESQNQLIDSKTYLARVNKIRLDWRKLGAIDRKLKTKLDAEFEQKFSLLNQPLVAAREAATLVRQRLIQSVAEINASERDAVDKVKLAQQHWQQAALTTLLDRKDEQKLWNQFRSVCDAIFAQRKTNIDQQKQQKEQSIAAKLQYCERLEAMMGNASADISLALRSAQHEWRELSQQVRGLDARFEQAVANLEKRQTELLVLDKQAGLVTLRAKIKLCQRLEAAAHSVHSNGLELAAALQKEWEALAEVHSILLTTALSKLLMQRFGNALVALKNQQLPDPKSAMENLAQFEERLLRLELMRGLSSPVELSQQRMQLQVKDLQSALRHRDAAENYLSNLWALCTLPVVLTAQHEQRFQLILDDSIH